MVKIFYQDVKCTIEDIRWFDIKKKENGVKQGCNMPRFLFLTVTDWAMRRTVGRGANCIRWKFTSKLDDVDFSDDVLLKSCAKQQIQDKTAIMDREADN